MSNTFQLGQRLSIILVVIILLSAGCNTPLEFNVVTPEADLSMATLPSSGGSGENPLANTRWELIAFDEQQPVAMPRGSWPILDFRENTLVFDVGCNNPAAFYAVQGNQIIIQPSARTLMDCSGELGDDVMALEAALFTTLDSFDSILLRNDELIIRYADRQMVLQRLKGD